MARSRLLVVAVLSTIAALLFAVSVGVAPISFTISLVKPPDAALSSGAEGDDVGGELSVLAVAAALRRAWSASTPLGLSGARLSAATEDHHSNTSVDRSASNRDPALQSTNDPAEAALSLYFAPREHIIGGGADAEQSAMDDADAAATTGPPLRHSGRTPAEAAAVVAQRRLQQHRWKSLWAADLAAAEAGSQAQRPTANHRDASAAAPSASITVVMTTLGDVLRGRQVTSAPNPPSFSSSTPRSAVSASMHPLASSVWLFGEVQEGPRTKTRSPTAATTVAFDVSQVLSPQTHAALQGVREGSPSKVTSLPPLPWTCADERDAAGSHSTAFFSPFFERAIAMLLRPLLHTLQISPPKSRHHTNSTDATHHGERDGAGTATAAERPMAALHFSDHRSMPFAPRHGRGEDMPLAPEHLEGVLSMDTSAAQRHTVTKAECDWPAVAVWAARSLPALVVEVPLGVVAIYPHGPMSAPALATAAARSKSKEAFATDWAAATVAAAKGSLLHALSAPAEEEDLPSIAVARSLPHAVLSPEEAAPRRVGGGAAADPPRRYSAVHASARHAMRHTRHRMRVGVVAAGVMGTAALRALRSVRANVLEANNALLFVATYMDKPLHTPVPAVQVPPHHYQDPRMIDTDEHMRAVLRRPPWCGPPPPPSHSPPPTASGPTPPLDAVAWGIGELQRLYSPHLAAVHLTTGAAVGALARRFVRVQGLHEDAATGPPMDGEAKGLFGLPRTVKPTNTQPAQQLLGELALWLMRTVLTEDVERAVFRLLSSQQPQQASTADEGANGLSNRSGTTHQRTSAVEDLQHLRRLVRLSHQHFPWRGAPSQQQTSMDTDKHALPPWRWQSPIAASAQGSGGSGAWPADLMDSSKPHDTIAPLPLSRGMLIDRTALVRSILSSQSAANQPESSLPSLSEVLIASRGGLPAAAAATTTGPARRRLAAFLSEEVRPFFWGTRLDFVVRLRLDAFVPFPVFLSMRFVAADATGTLRGRLAAASPTSTTDSESGAALKGPANVDGYLRAADRHDCLRGVARLVVVGEGRGPADCADMGILVPREGTASDGSGEGGSDIPPPPSAGGPVASPPSSPAPPGALPRSAAPLLMPVGMLQVLCRCSSSRAAVVVTTETSLTPMPVHHRHMLGTVAITPHNVHATAANGTASLGGGGAAPPPPFERTCDVMPNPFSSSGVPISATEVKRLGGQGSSAASAANPHSGGGSPSSVTRLPVVPATRAASGRVEHQADFSAMQVLRTPHHPLFVYSPLPFGDHSVAAFDTPFADTAMQVFENVFVQDYFRRVGLAQRPSANTMSAAAAGPPAPSPAAFTFPPRALPSELVASGAEQKLDESIAVAGREWARFGLPFLQVHRAGSFGGGGGSGGGRDGAGGVAQKGPSLLGGGRHHLLLGPLVAANVLLFVPPSAVAAAGAGEHAKCDEGSSACVRLLYPPPGIAFIPPTTVSAAPHTRTSSGSSAPDEAPLANASHRRLPPPPPRCVPLFRAAGLSAGGYAATCLPTASAVFEWPYFAVPFDEGYHTLGLDRHYRSLPYERRAVGGGVVTAPMLRAGAGATDPATVGASVFFRTMDGSGGGNDGGVSVPTVGWHLLLRPQHIATSADYAISRARAVWRSPSLSDDDRVDIIAELAVRLLLQRHAVVADPFKRATVQPPRTANPNPRDSSTNSSSLNDKGDLSNATVPFHVLQPALVLRLRAVLLQRSADANPPRPRQQKPSADLEEASRVVEGFLATTPLLEPSRGGGGGVADMTRRLPSKTQGYNRLLFALADPELGLGTIRRADAQRMAAGAAKGAGVFAAVAALASKSPPPSTSPQPDRSATANTATNQKKTGRRQQQQQQQRQLSSQSSLELSLEPAAAEAFLLDAVIGQWDIFTCQPRSMPFDKRRPPWNACAPP